MSQSVHAKSEARALAGSGDESPATPKPKEKRLSKLPNPWHFVGYGFLAALSVAIYAYLSWTAIEAPPFFKYLGLDALSWAEQAKSLESTSTNREASTTEKNEFNAKMLDLRGKLGDSFGPVNALLSSLGFIALLYSINLQRAISAEQSRVQQESIKNQEITARQQEKLQQRQRFEELLSITIAANRSALNDISWVIWVKDSAWEAPQIDLQSHIAGLRAEHLRPSLPAATMTGKKALYTIWLNDVEDEFRNKVSMLNDAFAKEIATRYAEIDESAPENESQTKRLATAFIQQSFEQSDWPTREHVFTRLTQTYNEMYGEHEHQLDAYFRTLYRVFELLSRGETDYGLKETQVREYAAIARAQLSWQELAFVLLNCCAAKFEKAGRLYNYFALFDNLTDRSSIVTTLLRTYVEADKRGSEKLSKPDALSKLTHHAFNTDNARTLSLPPKYVASGIADAPLVQPSS